MSIFLAALHRYGDIHEHIHPMNLRKPLPPPEDDLLSGPRIARKLDIDPATVRRWVREGAPHHVLGDKLIRFRLDELLAWRATHKRKVVSGSE
jgi:hypothetical protein